MNRLLVAALAALACTDASLYSLGSQPNLANKISFEGEICTDDPAAIALPVKVLVVMDGTAQLVSADPTGQRADALEALMQRYSGPNYHFGVVQYATQARSPTGGFAGDLGTLEVALDVVRIGTAEGQRSYLDALRVATTAIQDDVLGSTPGQRSRTRYAVVFVAAGGPQPALAEVWCRGRGLDPDSDECRMAVAEAFCPDVMPPPRDCEQLVYPQMIRDLRKFALDNGAQDLVLHTIALRTDPAMPDAAAERLLVQMATAGRGAFSAQDAGSLNLLANDLATPSSLFLRRELLVYNPNAALRDSRLVADSDGDGLVDEEEMRLGTQPLAADSDGDFVGDAIERLLAAPGLTFDPLVPTVPTECMLIDPPDGDTDADGLTDCEEVVLRTDPSLVDSDRDGIPDLVEIRRGGNPLVDDVLADTDVDGVLNGDELRGGLDVSTNDAASELDYGYRYRFFDEGARMRIEATPTEPVPGVRILQVDSSVQGPARLVWAPPTLAFADDPTAMGPAGDPVDVSAGGEHELISPSGRTMRVRVDATQLPGEPREPQLLLRATNRSCFHFDVRNVTLVETEEIPGGRPGRGWNNLRIYFAELPEDAPRGYGIFNVASVPVRFVAPDFKDPDRAFVTLEQDAFVLLGGDL